MCTYQQTNRFVLICFLSLILTLPVLATGVLDRTFGTNGITANLGDGSGSHFGGTIIVQPDDKILIFGTGRYTTTESIVVNRYNADGSPDNTFSADSTIAIGSKARFSDAALQPDGKIVVVGTDETQIGSFNDDYFIARLNSDGSFDETFGANGKVIINRRCLLDRLGAIDIQPDGKLIVAGYTRTADCANIIGEIVRLNPNGSVDTTFGNNGFLTFNEPYLTEVRDVQVTANGKIIVAGTASSNRAMLFRLNFDGTVDNTFGQNGFVQVGEEIYRIFIQPDGKIFTSGNMLRRFLPNGSTDPSFKIQQGGFVKLLSNGRLLTTGSGGAISLLNPNGQLIGNANTNGIPRGDFLQFVDVATQSNGKIVTSIFSRRPFTPTFPTSVFLVRYNSITSQANKLFNFDNDEASEIGVFRPSTNTFFIQTNNNSQGYITYTAQTPVNRIIPEDGLVWSSVQQGYNFFCNQYDNPSNCFQWGLATDTAIGGDYDGDNKSDFAIFRDGLWHIRKSSDGESLYYNWGQTGDKPVPADYDYDGITDVAIYRPSTGVWWVLRSSDLSYTAVQFGIAEDKPVQADYDGDGRADFAVYRASNGVWYLLKSTEGFAAAGFGLSTDKPVPGDYDGDGLTDIAVFRPSDGNWYLLQSKNGFGVVHWGQNGDVPLSTAYAANN